MGKGQELYNKAKIITSDIINEYSKEYQVIQDNSNSIVKRLEPIKHKINEAPYEAWFVRVKDITDKEELLSAEEYKDFVESEQE